MNAKEYLVSDELAKEIKWLLKKEENRHGFDALMPIKIIEIQENGTVSSDMTDYFEYCLDNL